MFFCAMNIANTRGAVQSVSLTYLIDYVNVFDRFR